jgi:hypothetical protein
MEGLLGLLIFYVGPLENALPGWLKIGQASAGDFSGEPPKDCRSPLVGPNPFGKVRNLF